MNAIESNSRTTISVPVESVLLTECRTVFIEGEITMESANEFKHTMLYLLHKEPDEPITVHISSPGGSVDAGMMIYDLIKGINAEVNMVCTGVALSIAAVIFAGAKRRSMWPHSKLMIHQPWLANGVSCTASEICRTAEEIMKRKSDIVKALSADTGKSADVIENAIAYDNYFTAEEAVAFNLADEIVNTVI